jgi:hypothetical protein
MTSIKRLIVTMAAFTAAASATALPIVTFTLDPLDGYLAGAAGTPTGWGYTITSTNNVDPDTQNPFPAYVFIEGFTFGDETTIGTFRQFDPSTGATEGAPIVALWSFNASGLQYDLDPEALVGSSSRGLMTLSYDVYSDSEQINAIEYGLAVNARMSGSDVNAEVFVNAPAAMAPEPASAAMIALCVAALLRRLRAGGSGTAR